MATREEYVAAAAALAEYAKEQIEAIPAGVRQLVLQHISMESIGEKVNEAAVKAVDAAAQARSVAVEPQPSTKTTP